MKFAHLGDCHLGGWRQPELSALNSQSFQIAIDGCIKEKVDFVLVAGDLFDVSYPPIESIKDAFEGFRKLKEKNIPVFLIAGSHDYSPSGKTFLDVLEKAGFCENVFKSEIRDNKIVLHPTIFKNIAIYGYPGKKSGIEVPEIEKIKLQDAPGLFKILMLHTTIRDAIGSLPVSAVDEARLPKVDYLALAHLHIKYQKANRVYCGPTFPNSSPELEELQMGSYYIVDTNGKIERKEIKIKPVIIKNFEIKNAIIATEEIVATLKKENLKDSIVIMKLSGTIETGAIADIKFEEIDAQVKKSEAYVLLKNTTNLYSEDSNITFEVSSGEMEEAILNKFKEEHESQYNSLISVLIPALQIEKKEDEKVQNFEERLMEDFNKLI